MARKREESGPTYELILRHADGEGQRGWSRCDVPRLPLLRLLLLLCHFCRLCCCRSRRLESHPTYTHRVSIPTFVHFPEKFRIWTKVGTVRTWVGVGANSDKEGEKSKNDPKGVGGPYHLRGRKTPV